MLKDAELRTQAKSLFEVQTAIYNPANNLTGNVQNQI
jgi:hypothetical protein